ncbi:MAG: hypothetical protein ACLP5V_07650 [Candidatus Bathyarchaeia archaeon]
MTHGKDNKREQNPADQNVNLDAKDYVALAIAMAETTMLPMIFLIVVLAAVGLFISIFLFH